MTILEPTRAEGCPSDRALDEWLAGELPADRRASLDAHVPGCEDCSARHRARLAARTAFPLEAPAFDKLVPASEPAPAPRRRWLRWWAVGPALAAVAALVLVARPLHDEQDEVRTKGHDALGFFVLHAGAVRQGARGEVVRPGDRLQLVTTTSAPRFLAVLERDAGGRVSVFFPRGDAAAPVTPGRGVALPTSVVLDEAVGVGTLYGVFCERAVTLAPMVRELEQRGDGARWPAGCHVDQLSYESRRE
jgi:hypothetical protein